MAQFALRSRRSVGNALKVYVCVLGALWGLALLVVAVRGLLLHQGYPFNTFLLVPDFRFSDFTVFDARFAVWGQGDKFFSLPGFKFDYPAPLLLGTLAYYKLAPAPLYAYLATVILFAITGAILAAMAVPKTSLVRPLAAAAALCTALFSYPLFFMLDRGNIEGLVWIATSAGVALFASRRYSSAAIFIALAASMKIFPAVLLLLLLARKRYRDFALAVASVVGFTVGSLWLSGPSIKRAGQGILEGLDYLREVQILDYKAREITFDHSLFAFMKQVCFRIIHDVPKVNALLPRFYLVYGICVAAAFVALYFSTIRHLPVLNQLLALTALSVLLPYVSYDYTLVHLFTPFAILVIVLATDGADGRLKLSRGQLMFLLLPFAVLFTPQSYLVYHIVGYAGQFKTLALCVVVGAALRIPLRSSLFRELRPAETLRLDLDLEPAVERWEQKYV